MKKTKKWMSALTAAAVLAASSLSVVSLSASAADEPPYTAWLSISAGGEEAWDTTYAGEVAASIDGDGEYSASYTIQGDGSETISLLILSTDINSYAYAPDGAGAGTNQVADGCTVDLAISSIVVTHTDGTETEITYNGPSDGTLAVENNGTDLRVNIFNEWTTPQVSDIDSTIDGGLATGDTITVNFTVSGMDALDRGDVNGDGVITLEDASLALIAYVNGQVGNASGLTAIQETAANVDYSEDGITLKDASYILQYYVSMQVGGDPDWATITGVE